MSDKQIKDTDGLLEEAMKPEEKRVELSTLINLGAFYRVKGKSGLWAAHSIQYGRNGYAVMVSAPDKKRKARVRTSSLKPIGAMIFQTNKGIALPFKTWVDNMFREMEGQKIDITDERGFAKEWGLPTHVCNRVVEYYNCLIDILNDAIETNQQKNDGNDD